MTMQFRSLWHRSLLGLAVIALIMAPNAPGQTLTRNVRTQQYRDLQTRLARGWNTWYNNSMITHAHLPEGFAVCLSLAAGPVDLQREYFKVSKATKRNEAIVPGVRADDGSYTSLTCTLGGTTIGVQTATDDGDLVILVTPVNTGNPPVHRLVVESSILWNRAGTLSTNGHRISGSFAEGTIQLSPVGQPLIDPYVPARGPYLVFPLNSPVRLYTGRSRTADEIDNILERKRTEQVARAARYGDLSEAFTAMQTILAWNVIYDAGNDRVISPVSRWWNANWGGFVLFDWDTYFASFMYSLFNKDLAYANAVEITKSITPCGFIPNYSAPDGTVSWDRSQPPIGSFVINEIYMRYREKWFLEETYDELLSWNRWWPGHRSIKGYLAWGSDMVPDSLKTIDKHNAQAAMYESGLDNSPMYDGVPFNPTTNTLELADVGLMSLYVMDCHALAEIAGVLGKGGDAAELRERGKRYAAKLESLWDKERGIYLNRSTLTGTPNPRLSPTNFYPMIAGVCTAEQASRMITEHYFNAKEFHGEYVLPSIARSDSAFEDNNYWRGRIWAPMNFLVYLGMRNYDIPGARADLTRRSFALLMRSWKKNGSVFENYNAVTGEGDDVGNADSFYHWGALLAFMSFIEQGYLQK